jgi:hypothetical protein
MFLGYNGKSPENTPVAGIAETVMVKLSVV